MNQRIARRPSTRSSLGALLLASAFVTTGCAGVGVGIGGGSGLGLGVGFSLSPGSWFRDPPPVVEVVPPPRFGDGSGVSVEPGVVVETPVRR